MAVTTETMSKFIFESSNLIKFCTDFEKEKVEDQTDSLLEVKLQDLQSRWDALNKVYEKVSIAEDTEFKTEAHKKFQLCTEAFYICKSHILDQFKIFQSSSAETNITSRLSLPLNPTSVPCIKVPPCDTETFYGSYEDWPSFRDMFTAVYLNHPKLTPAVKLYHLRNKTRGKAGAIVKQYTLCDENFSLAWEALRARFENKRILIDKQLKTLFNITPVTSEDSEGIQKVQTTINDCLVILKSQGISVSDWDPILVYLCSSKLPEETLSLWEQSLESRRELPKWFQMDQFLTSRYEVVERLHEYKNIKSRSSLPSKQSSKIQAYHSQEKLGFACKLCNDSHTLKSCSEFRKLSVPERTKFVKQVGYCTNCFAYNQSVNNCPSHFRCLHCRKNHHTMLHPPIPNKSESKTSGRNPSTQHSTDATNLLHTESVQQSRHPIFDLTEGNWDETASTSKDSNIQANFSTNNEKTLLPTAQVHIEHLGSIFTLRALIDQGSQKTFVSEKVQKRLELPSYKENVSVTGMGGKIVENATRVCQLTIVSQRHNIRIPTNAIVLKQLTSFLPSFKIPTPDLTELKDLDLADPQFFTPGQIDLVIGSDLIPQVLLQGIKHKVLGSLLAQNSVFGWFLSGPLTSTQFSTFHAMVHRQSTNRRLPKAQGKTPYMVPKRQTFGQFRHLSIDISKINRKKSLKSTSKPIPNGIVHTQSTKAFSKATSTKLSIMTGSAVSITGVLAKHIGPAGLLSLIIIQTILLLPIQFTPNLIFPKIQFAQQQTVSLSALELCGILLISQYIKKCGIILKSQVCSSKLKKPPNTGQRSISYPPIPNQELLHKSKGSVHDSSISQYDEFTEEVKESEPRRTITDQKCHQDLPAVIV